MKPLSRRHFLAATGLAALAGCSSLGPGPDGNGGDGGNGGGNGGDGTGGNGGNGGGGGNAGDGNGDNGTSSGSVPTAETTLPLPMSPTDLRSEARSGGPPKDGIPAIDEPQFQNAGQADFLDDGDPVFGVARDGVVKAYPQKILVQHEIVNDTLGDLPVAVTYCPLTGTAQGFERGGTTFGVSGRLINNNLVMYDRASETWWPQILATAIPGPWNEDPEIRSLREFRLVWTTWGQWRDHHPETRVLSTDTGFAKNYNRDPYGAYDPARGYYARESTLFPRLNPDDRFHPKEVFMGARTPAGAVAVRKDALAARKLVTGRLAETPLLAVFDPRLDTGYWYRNPDERAFEHEGGTVRDGDGQSFEPDALPLDRVYTFDAMWFAWSGYYPDSTVYE